MFKLLLTVVGSFLMILNLLALDDITTGNQPHFLWEYLMLGSNVVVAPLLYRLWKQS